MPQVALLMSGGQFVVANIGSFTNAHKGVVRDAEAPQAPHPPRLQLPSPSDLPADPIVHPGDAITSARSARLGTEGGDDEDEFNDENEVDVENATPLQAAALSPLTPVPPVQPLGPSASQPVRTPYFTSHSVVAPLLQIASSRTWRSCVPHEFACALQCPMRLHRCVT